MARRVILDTQYTFTPSSKTITIPRVIQRERLLLITNVTTNQVIYNFSDSTLTATSYTITQGTNSVSPVTTLVLNYNTTSMSSTDKLQITVDEIAEAFEPAEAYIDPVGKMRVSTPQALIDTDFEYGLQPTKWESLVLLNNRPSFFVNPQNPMTISDVKANTGNDQVVVYTTTPPAVGTPVLIQDTFFAGGNGPFIVNSNTSTTFTYSARYVANITGSIYNSSLTTVANGAFYSNSAYQLASQPTYNGQVITLNTVEPHGLQVGDGVYITNAVGGTGANGSFQVAAVMSNTQLQVIANTTVSGGVISSASLYPRPDGYYVHRAFDGGVQFSTGNPAHNIQTIRQTRRYFRYQSGKGIQVSTGTIFKPNINIDDLSISTGSTINVTTKVVHQLQPGTIITISGANETAYNGTFTVSQVLNAFQFQYVAASVPSATTASGITILSVVSWYGSKNRLGMYDTQNGVFFEFDGQTLYAVRRNSTAQIGGQVNVTNNSSLVTGASINGVTTKFSKQLVPGDFIVIRGMSYRVMDILSDTAMTVSPPYRGPTLSGFNTAIVSKTVDTKVPQSQWNIDKLDGTGPSGLSLDLSKMQMWYMDYSWYGAGTIRYGFRDTQGRVYYCHRFVNNNQNTEAWMRSGNLPARYETNTFAPVTTLANTIGLSETTIVVANTAGFPNTGTLLVANTLFYEYVNYTSTNNTTFLGVTRGKPNTSIASVTTTISSANVTTNFVVTGLQNGMAVYGAGIPLGTYIYNITTGTPNIITLTQAATASATVQMNFQNMGAFTGNSVHTYSATAPIGVYLHAPQFAPTISHWGTSVIMDGGFDNDKSLVFLYGETANTPVPAGSSYALLSIRVSPSVDSGIPSTLGQKELINRMQLTLNSLDVLANGSFLVSLVLNGTPVAGTGTLGSYQRIATGTSSLTQVADHTGQVTLSGGENIFGFYAVNSAGAGNQSVISQDLTKLRDLGNSILGGGFGNTPGVNTYPDGPDVLTVVAQNIGSSTAAISTRLSWTEAQA